MFSSNAGTRVAQTQYVEIQQPLSAFFLWAHWTTTQTHLPSLRPCLSEALTLKKEGRRWQEPNRQLEAPTAVFVLWLLEKVTTGQREASLKRLVLFAVGSRLASRKVRVGMRALGTAELIHYQICLLEICGWLEYLQLCNR